MPGSLRSSRCPRCSRLTSTCRTSRLRRAQAGSTRGIAARTRGSPRRSDAALGTRGRRQRRRRRLVRAARSLDVTASSRAPCACAAPARRGAGRRRAAGASIPGDRFDAAMAASRSTTGAQRVWGVRRVAGGPVSSPPTSDRCRVASSTSADGARASVPRFRQIALVEQAVAAAPASSGRDAGDARTGSSKRLRAVPEAIPRPDRARVAPSFGLLPDGVERIVCAWSGLPRRCGTRGTAACASRTFRGLAAPRVSPPRSGRDALRPCRRVRLSAFASPDAGVLTIERWRTGRQRRRLDSPDVQLPAPTQRRPVVPVAPRPRRRATYTGVRRRAREPVLIATVQMLLQESRAARSPRRSHAARPPFTDRVTTSPAVAGGQTDRATRSSPDTATPEPRMTAVPAIELNDGNRIPQLGFGVFQIPPDETAAGGDDGARRRLPPHRHRRDVRQRGGVGEAVRASGLDRDEVFVTSKLNNGFHRPDDARARVRAGRSTTLGFDYVDLFLIHWPLPTLYDGDFVSTWKTLEEFKRDGRARSIGVSNFQVAHLERLAAECDVVPAVNQIELHPYFQNGEVDAYGREHGIVTEAWSPIAQGQCSATRRSARSRPRPAARRHRSCCAGTSSAATSSSRSRSTPGADAREPRRSSTSS